MLKGLRPFAILFVALGSLMVISSTPDDAAHAAPFSPACEPHGYLFQYPTNTPPTQATPIDLVTNSLGTTTNISGVTVNAVGYNVQDHFMYGWDNTAKKPVKINGDFTIDTSFNVVNAPTIPGSVPAGDVDQNGQYWFATGSDWYRIDLTGSPVTYNGDTGAIYGGGPNNLAPSSSDIDFPRDFAYVPPTILNENNDGQEGLYTVVIDKTATPHTVELYRFNTTTIAAPTWDHIGSLTNPGMPDNSIEAADINQAGALYADAAGALYVAGNADGSLWRVIIGNDSEAIALRPYKLANGSPSELNDGVRCASAMLPADFGDAPSSYATFAGDFGPLHLLGNFNEANSTASLMLGDLVDMEVDGYGHAGEAPGAKQDDNNHQPVPPFIDDEDSVQHIVAPPSPVDLSVPVVVTNNTSNPATLAGWIDTNGDGSFSDEQSIIKNIPANAGRGTYELVFPGLDLSSNTYARFRLYEGTGLTNDQLQPWGLESAFLIGEVEDYQVQVGSFSASKTADPPKGSEVSPGETLTYTLTITNTGTTDLVGLTVHDDLSDVLDDATMEGDPVVDPSSAGSATVTGDTLEFKGDVPTGQSVKVTYKVKVKPADQLTNNSMQNFVIAAHTNCHPGVNDDGSITVNHADCNTHHQVAGLANTGTNMLLLLTLAAGLIVISGTGVYAVRKLYPRTAKKQG
jgi:uncharacterized repeat protein (TIGR01451 family)